MIPWAKLHGASTHFPIVLTLVALACDLAAAIWWNKPPARGLSAAGAGAMGVAAGGSIVAVVSGLFLVHGAWWGTGALGWHHRLVWPAFALIVGAATWRWLSRDRITRAGQFIYLGVVLVSAGLISGAGYFGGELLLGA